MCGLLESSGGAEVWGLTRCFSTSVRAARPILQTGSCEEYFMTESASTPRLRATFAIYLGAGGGHRDRRAQRRCRPAWYYISGVLGFLCVALACLGRIWASVFIAGHKDVELVTTGPYARCRHPLYSCSILGALGLGLTTRSLAAVRHRRGADRRAGDLCGVLRRAVPGGCISGRVQGLRRGHTQHVVARRAARRPARAPGRAARRCSGKPSSMRDRFSCSIFSWPSRRSTVCFRHFEKEPHHANAPSHCLPLCWRSPPVPHDPPPATQAAETKSTAELLNTYWKLTQLGEQVITTPEGAREIHIVLQSENQRVAGFSGCNSMMGSYVLEGDKLRFAQMAGTMMACVDSGMELEQKFLSIFPQVAHWKIRGETLQLRDADGKTAGELRIALPQVAQFRTLVAEVCRQRYSRITRHFEQSLSSPSMHWRSSPLRCASLKPQSRQRSRAS